MKRLAFILGIVSVILAFPTSSRAQTNKIILPSEATNSPGDGAAILFNTPVEQVYANSEFASVSGDLIWITEIAFRQKNPRALDVVLPRISIRMGVFQGAMQDVPSGTYINAADVVFDQINYHVTAPVPSSVQDFPVRFRLQRPYLYNRKLGQLLVFFHNPDSFTGSRQEAFDAHILSALRGIHIFFNSDRIYAGADMITTEFSYSVLSLVISSVTVVSNSTFLQIDVRLPIPTSSLKLESGADPAKHFVIENDVTFSSGPLDAKRALVPVPRTNTFYRVRLQ